jgi:hypothetical protein
MIYERVESSKPIQQGDIFRNIPRLEISLAEIPVVDEEGTRVTSWQELLDEGTEDDITAVVKLKAVSGIVITQDCDAARGKDVSLALIDDFQQVTNKSPETPKSWWKHITNHAKSNLRYFYLPADESFDLPRPSAADFRTILRVPREEVMTQGGFRVGRLNSVAYEHFRESLAQFFRRYPYNEWYPLTKEQAEDYAESSPEPVEFYDWQK